MIYSRVIEYKHISNVLYLIYPEYQQVVILDVLRVSEYIEEIYFFFEVNTEYISSNVLKISAFSQVHSMSEN